MDLMTCLDKCYQFLQDPTRRRIAATWRAQTCVLRDVNAAMASSIAGKKYLYLYIKISLTCMWNIRGHYDGAKIVGNLGC